MFKSNVTSNFTHCQIAIENRISLRKHPYMNTSYKIGTFTFVTSVHSRYFVHNWNFVFPFVYILAYKYIIKNTSKTRYVQTNSNFNSDNYLYLEKHPTRLYTINIRIEYWKRTDVQYLFSTKNSNRTAVCNEQKILLK
jgi:hypothetical protein